MCKPFVTSRKALKEKTCIDSSEKNTNFIYLTYCSTKFSLCFVDFEKKNLSNKTFIPFFSRFSFFLCRTGAPRFIYFIRIFNQPIQPFTRTPHLYGFVKVYKKDTLERILFFCLLLPFYVSVKLFAEAFHHSFSTVCWYKGIEKQLKQTFSAFQIENMVGCVWASCA